MSEKARELAERLVKILTKAKMTVACAESCTGGGIAALITSIPGASEAFGYGFVTYANKAKHDLLGVKNGTLKAFGAVSPQTALEMSMGARIVSGADCALAVTGIAGPGGGTPEKPVGLVYISVCTKSTAVSHEYNFEGDREAVRTQTAEAALELVIGELTR